LSATGSLTPENANVFRKHSLTKRTYAVGDETQYCIDQRN
jgi:hypothetical protein